MVTTMSTNFGGTLEWEKSIDARHVNMGMLADDLTVDAHVGNDDEVVVHKNRSVVLV
jgi:hypothetical protein